MKRAEGGRQSWLCILSLVGGATPAFPIHPRLFAAWRWLARFATRPMVELSEARSTNSKKFIAHVKLSRGHSTRSTDLAETCHDQPLFYAAHWQLQMR